MHEDDERHDHRFGEGIPLSPEVRPKPGDIILTPGGAIREEPLVGGEESTPLEEHEPEGVIPQAVLFPLKLHRHTQLPHIFGHPHRLREKVGDGDAAVYLMDDGSHHAMIGRAVGEGPEATGYALVGRIERARADDLTDGRLGTEHAFDGAHELTLCGTDINEQILTSMVFDVDRYDSLDEVPAEYRPPSPFINFKDDLEIMVD